MESRNTGTKEIRLFGLQEDTHMKQYMAKIFCVSEWSTMHAWSFLLNWSPGSPRASAQTWDPTGFYLSRKISMERPCFL